MHLWKHTLACTRFGLLAFSPLPAEGADKTQSLCTPEETLIFTCPMEGKRLASVCASSDYGPDSGYVQFRQGIAGKTELTLPATQTAPSKAAKRGSWMFAGGGGAYLQFADGNTTHTVFSATGRWGDNGESADRAGVATTTDGRVTNRPCTTLSNSELEAIPDPTAALPLPAFPDEAQRLRIITERLRQDMHQRVHDLTLIGRTRERLFGELAFARSIQERLRPLPLPPTEELEVAAFVHTADEVCGDMYDYFFQSPRRLCCIMGNVTEKGVPAALLMRRIGPLLHELLLSGFPPGKALGNINRMLPLAAAQDRSKAPTMISALAWVLDLDSGVFRWASAGQLPPFLCRTDRVEPMEWTGNTALGIRAEEVYLEQETRLAVGESLLFAGQRLLSLSGETEESYTMERLGHFMQSRNEALSDLLPLLYADIRRTLGREPQDDLTFFAVRLRHCHGAPVVLRQWQH